MCHLYNFFGEISIQVFLNGIVSLFAILRAICFLYINPSFTVLFANIFSYSMGCLFTFLIVSFGTHKF